ncbi:hypothetical protein BDV95DRAFT_502001 [Massariosphaeria phaeospora]|uniref:Rhodopsin domain-containing protein n=1 Tax=Massariosphaeria phaeospora TaxID=100035 RepID=A0A7C8M503_9PLEO|nr:hypothetical protein BDV95DRAFT_502001 [Massariosphaeria phaeospora]
MASAKQFYTGVSEGPSILAATLTVTISALLTTVSRLYVRTKMIRNLGWDDYIMGIVMSLVSRCVAGQAIIIPEVQLGAGRHIDDIPYENFQTAFKLNFVTQAIYLIAICVVKESVGFFLLRIATTTSYRRLIIFIMVFMGLYTFGCFLSLVLQCTDLAVLWDRTVKGTCWKPTTLKALSYTNIALNITTDLLFAVIIPIPMLWNVQMNRRQKASIIGILALGVFATAAAFVKISAVSDYGRSGDWLWDSRRITIWTVIECNIGIVAGNLPCLKPLVRSVLGSTSGHGSRTHTTAKYLSRPYGTGTSRELAQDNYNSLVSNQTQDAPFRAYGEALMLTTIGAGKERSDISSLQEDTSSKKSDESISDEQTQAFAKLGGITRTTEVNISGSVPVDPFEHMEEGMIPERKEAHMV